MKLIEAMQEFYLSMDGVRSPSTIKWYENRLKNLEAYFGSDHDVSTITLHDLRAWRSDLASRTARWVNHPTRKESKGGLSVESIFCHVRAARKFFKFLVEEEIIQKNPAIRFELPTLPKRRKKGLSECDRDAIISAAMKSGIRDYAICLLLADSAARLAGIAGLTIEHLDMGRRMAIVREKGKGGGTDRMIWFTEKTADAITSYLAVRPKVEHDRLFCSEFFPYDPLQGNGIYQMIKRLAKETGVKSGWNPHNWRHGAIRGMLDNGMPLPAASEIAGHNSTQITGDIYGSYPDNVLQKMHDKYSWIQNTLF